MKHIPWKDVGAFRVGDIIDFDGVLGMLTKLFAWRNSPRYGPEWAWQVTPINPKEYIPHYPGDEYGLSITNLGNGYKGKVVARGPEV
jgi:hypothetical protein